MRGKEETMPRDSGEGPSGLLPPTSIEDLLHSLDLASATSRDKKVVTVQGENEDQVSLSGGAGPPQPCSSSSDREPTDEEILSNEMIKNLDTGEEIPLIQAVENLPSGIHPLTLHIMKRTKEYSTNDVHQSDDDKAAQTDTDGSKLTQQLKKTVAKSVKGAKHLAEKCGEKVVTMVKSVRSDTFQSQRHQQQQSEDDDGKVESPVTYTDGGTFKQKTTQMKKFIGKSVDKAKHLTEKYGEKAINKVKGFRSDAAQSPQEQEQYQEHQEHQDEHEEEQEKEQQHTDENVHKAVIPLTDTDGGKLKQKTTTVRKFIGKSVKKAKHLTEKYGEKAINKVKSFRDDASQSTQESKQYQEQEEQDEQYEQEEHQHTHGEEQDEQYKQEEQQHTHGDDHEVESPVTDTDGGKLKQKTTTVKKFIGKSVKKAKHLTEKYGEKAINKMKRFRGDAAQSPQKQELEEQEVNEEEQQQSDDDDQAEVSATDSDGGSQREKSAGKPGNKHLAEEYEQKSANKVKRVHDDAAQSGDDEEQEQRQSDDDDKAVAPVTDTDGGKFKPKSTQLKMFMEKSVTGAKHLAEKYGEKSAVNTAQLKEFLGRSVKGAKQLAEKYGEKAVSKVKSVHEVFHPDQEDEGKPYVGPAKFKASHSFEGPFKFDQMKVVQDLSGVHTGAVWAMKFSLCGRLLATAGHDKMVRIWVLKTAFDHFNNMRTNNNTEGCVSPSPSQKSSCLSKSDLEIVACTPEDPDTEDRNAPFCQAPFCEYKGHKSDILDLSWSKDYLLLSSSMDKTVRLWHISRRECQWCFPHKDIVTAIAFHPREQRFFLSGSLDGKLRMWNIIDKKVELWNEVDSQKSQFITAANFCETGKYAIVGTLDGRCILYDSENFKYHTQILVRSTRGRNTVGHKITGIEPLPGENKILVTSNDSRIRLYDLRDMSLSMKYKGYANSSTRQIKASFSHDYSFIVSGSEDKYVYIWSTYHNSRKLTSVRRDRNDFWEGIKAHNIVVTSAIFAPHPGLIVPQEAESKSTYSKDSETVTSGSLETTDHTEVLVSADYTGAIKVFINVKGREVALKQDTWDTEVPEQEGRTLQVEEQEGSSAE